MLSHGVPGYFDLLPVTLHRIRYARPRAGEQNVFVIKSCRTCVKTRTIHYYNRNVQFQMMSSTIDSKSHLTDLCNIFARGLNEVLKVRKTARIRNRYNQAPHLPQDTKWKSNKFTKKHHKKRANRSALPLQVTTRQQ